MYSKPIKKPDFVFNNAIKSVQLDYDVDMFYKHCEQIYVIFTLSQFGVGLYHKYIIIMTNLP